MRMAKAEPCVRPRHTISSCLASAASTNVMWYTQCHKPTILEGFKFTPFMSIDYSTIFFVRLDDIGDEWHCPEPRSFQQPYDLPPPGSRPHDLRLETTSSIGKAQSAPHPPSTGAYKQYSGWWSLAPAGGATDPVWNQMLSACCTLNSWRRKDCQMLKPKHKLGDKYVPRMWHPNTPVLSHLCRKSFGSNLLVVVVVAVKSFEGLDVHLDAASVWNVGPHVTTVTTVTTVCP